MSSVRHALVLAVLALALLGSCSRDNISTPADTVPPLPPIGLQATAEGGDLVRLSWAQNVETDLAGYRIYRSEGDGPFSPVTSQTLLCPWHYEHVPTMEIASFRVTAIDESGNESAYSEAVGIYLSGGWRGGNTNPVETR